MRIPLVGGADQRRSRIANAQRRVNYFPEANRADAGTPYTMYQRPGLRAVAQGPVAPVRGIFRASNGNGYCVIGNGVFSISRALSLTRIGTIGTQVGIVSFADNSVDGLLVDGSPTGYKLHLADNTFGVFVDSTGLFQGADRVDYTDTFLVSNVPGTNQFISSLSNTLGYDSTYVAAKTSYPDTIQSVIVNRRQILLIGSIRSEIWDNVGGANFPFAEVPGSNIEHGTVAKYSVAAQDIAVYWLQQSREGFGVVLAQIGYNTKRISNHALECAIQAMPRVDDAIGMCYQIGGHVFYKLTFPTADQTWVYDAAIADPDLAWHQEGWTDETGTIHRDRMNCVTQLYGQVIAGDHDRGTLYVLDRDHYTDSVNGQEYPISYICTFPQITSVPGQMGPTDADGHIILFNSFMADMEVGQGPRTAGGLPAQVELWYSNDRGASWRDPELMSAGAPGEYETRPTWKGLEAAQARIFEIRHNIAGPAALNGAWIGMDMTGS